LVTRKRIVIGVIVALALALGIGAAFVLDARRQASGSLDTDLSGVSLEKPAGPTTTSPTRRKPSAQSTGRKGSAQPAALQEGPCWLQFGGDAQRSLARPAIRLGRPTKPAWARGLGSYVEYPPVYCDGLLYLNTFEGATLAFEAETGKQVWRTRVTGAKPSSPAIAGKRLIVSSNDGSVTAYDRFSGRRLWRLLVGSRVESSPLVVDDDIYVGAADGRLFSVRAETGRVNWAFDTGGEINSSPTAVRNSVCITNYSGAVFCLRRSDGQKQWSTYVRRDSWRYESFYASASTDGQRLFSIARSGKVVALSASNGQILWTQHQDGWGYTTPAVSAGKIFVGGFDGALHAYAADSGRSLWTRSVGGRILGAPVQIGELVFFSTLEKKTYAVRAADGKPVWQIGMGKYSPVIATSHRYYMTLNGILVAFRAHNSPP
jgi:outer membrane protein assembly factor BamB